MPRPEYYDDLDRWQKATPRVLFVVKADALFAAPPHLGRSLLDLIDEAREAGLLFDEDSGEASIPPSKAERHDCLVAAQKAWDWRADVYERALENPAAADTHTRRAAADRHAELEGLPPIQWPTNENDKEA